MAQEQILTKTSNNKATFVRVRSSKDALLRITFGTLTVLAIMSLGLYTRHVAKNSKEIHDTFRAEFKHYLQSIKNDFTTEILKRFEKEIILTRRRRDNYFYIRPNSESKRGCEPCNYPNLNGPNFLRAPLEPKEKIRDNGAPVQLPSGIEPISSMMKGEQGYPGMRGEPGRKGEAGLRGPQGEKGEPADNFLEPGWISTKGDKGEPGAVGSPDEGPIAYARRPGAIPDAMWIPKGPPPITENPPN